MSDLIKEIQSLIDENKELKERISQYEKNEDSFTDKFDNAVTTIHDIKKILNQYDETDESINNKLDEVDGDEVTDEEVADEVDKSPDDSEDKSDFNLHQRIRQYLAYHNHPYDATQIINVLGDKHDLKSLKTKVIFKIYKDYLKE